jgi:hypothetical protein
MKAKTEILTEYRVSPRVVLRTGDKFRVTGGPYVRDAEGEKIAMAYRGVCTFVRAEKTGARVHIYATNKTGTVLLHVAGRRRNEYVPDLVCRPYKIKGRVRKGVRK